SVVYSRYFPYLPGRIAHYLSIDSMKLRKERVIWLLNCILKYDMQEIDDRFYELLPAETIESESFHDSTEHPFDVNWSMYDSLQPLNDSQSKEEWQHVRFD